MMRRALVCLLVAGLVAVLGSSGASASTPATGATTFAVEEGWLFVSAGYQAHISGVGLDGPWRGWHFAADVEQSSDCDAGGCPLIRFAWELYDRTPASSYEWGTCTGSATCQDYVTRSVSGLVSIPLTVSGGVPWSEGTGTVTGHLPPGSPYGIAAGYLTLTVDLH